MSIRVKIESNIYKYMCNLFHFLRILIFEKKRKKLYRYTLSRRNFYFSNSFSSNKFIIEM